MTDDQSIFRAKLLLHFTAAFATVLVLSAANIVAACLLHKPPKFQSRIWRRWALFSVQFLVSITFVAEGIDTLIRIFGPSQSGEALPEDYGVYLITSTAVHICLAASLFGSGSLLLYPYLTAWLVAFGYETALLCLAAIHLNSEDRWSRSRFGFSVARSFLLLLLTLITASCMLKDRTRSVKLDDESEALLAGAAVDTDQAGHTNGDPPETVHVDDDGSSTAADSDEDMGFDSEAEDPEESKEMRKKQKERLQQSGSWIGYLKEFRIFIPMVFPSSKDRLAQFCLVALVVMTLAESAIHLLVPRQIGIIINKLTDSKGTGFVPWVDIAWYALFMFLNSRAGISQLNYLARLPVDAFARKAIVTGAFNHIMALSMDFHNGKDSGELIRAIEQGTQLQDLVLMFMFHLTPIFIDLTLACIYVWILFGAYIALIPLGFGIAYVWTGAKSTTWTIGLRRALVATQRTSSTIQNEAISNWRTVSHFNRARYEGERYDDAVTKYNLAERWYYFVYFLSNAGQSLILLVAEMLVIILAITRVARGVTPVGSLVTLLQYWTMVEWPLAELSFNVRRMTTMLTDSERLLQLFLTKASIIDKPNAPDLQVTAGEVVFDHCSFAYDERKPILKDVSFTVKAGQTIALVGETGGGKSTILKLLYRYYDVNGGAIRIDGQDIRDVSLDSLRDAFGMVPQDPSLFNASITDNIRYARLDATDEEVADACRAAAIHDKIVSFPDGYASKVGERGVKLSGGEMQRVAIARAILREPRIVLLDEATSMIDAETEAVIQDAFRRLARDRTTFVIAHRLSTIQHADLILVVSEGSIVERGTHDELFARKGMYHRLWARQFNKDVIEAGKVLNAGAEEEDKSPSDGQNAGSL